MLARKTLVQVTVVSVLDCGDVSTLRFITSGFCTHHCTRCELVDWLSVCVDDLICIFCVRGHAG